MSKGGNMACVLNAANEVVVEAFLKDKIGFLEMSDVIENCMEKSTFVAVPTYDDFVSTNEQGRMLANELIK
jgi:1-deoxy-D-xylulose-5-phosphate reductoisomerase